MFLSTYCVTKSQNYVSKRAVTFGGALLSAITRKVRKLASLSGSRNFRGRGVDGTFATLQ